MQKSIMTKSLISMTAAAFLVGCAGPQPVAYNGLSSAAELKPNTAGPGNTPFAYSTSVDWQDYSKVILEPVAVYQGPDAAFGSLSGRDQEDLAAYMYAQFSKKLADHFTIVSTPAAGTLRIRLTLTGAAKSVPLLSTALHADIAGNLYNGVQLARGGPGLMTGSVLYSVEIYDAQSNQLLDAYVTKQYPNPENIFATLGTMAAAKTGIDKGANALVKQLD